MAAKPAPPRPVPRLYLATPVADDPSPLLASLPALLAGTDIAAVLVRLRPADPRTMISRVKALAPGVQYGGAAFVVGFFDFGVDVLVIESRRGSVDPSAREINRIWACPVYGTEAHGARLA